MLRLRLGLGLGFTTFPGETFPGRGFTITLVQHEGGFIFPPPW